MPDRYTECDELFDDDGEPVCDGDKVLINNHFEGVVRISAEGIFTVDGWPADKIIDNLEVITD